MNALLTPERQLLVLFLCAQTLIVLPASPPFLGPVCLPCQGCSLSMLTITSTCWHILACDFLFYTESACVVEKHSEDVFHSYCLNQDDRELCFLWCSTSDSQAQLKIIMSSTCKDPHVKHADTHSATLASRLAVSRLHIDQQGRRPAGVQYYIPSREDLSGLTSVLVTLKVGSAATSLRPIVGSIKSLASFLAALMNASGTSAGEASRKMSVAVLHGSVSVVTLGRICFVMFLAASSC